jgi:hypothetical protein
MGVQGKKEVTNEAYPANRVLIFLSKWGEIVRIWPDADSLRHHHQNKIMRLKP